ncbi:UNVERIFIED_CONTAM: anti-sigma factor, partial [Salmonella enterica subsp. enterica serovar Weltevreden]
MGLISEAESMEVVRMAASYPEIAREIAEISASLEKYAEKQA